MIILDLEAVCGLSLSVKAPGIGKSSRCKEFIAVMTGESEEDGCKDPSGVGDAGTYEGNIDWVKY